VILEPAPASPVDGGGAIAFGVYAGHTGPIDWGPVARRTGRRGALRWKRWHYVCIAGAAFVAGLAIGDVGWAGTGFAYLFDRRERRLLADFSHLGLPGRSARVADRAGQGALSTFASRGASLRLERSQEASWRVAVRGHRFLLTAILEETPASGTLCAIAPIEGGVANCTHKTSCLRARGLAHVGEATFDLGDCHATLDHTSGLLARNTRWHWASASGERIGLNLVEGFNGPIENAVWVDGRIESVGAASFEMDPAHPLDPWHIRTVDGAVELTFTPEGQRAEDKNLLFAMSRYVQPIGTFEGRASGVVVKDLIGVTEQHRARW